MMSVGHLRYDEQRLRAAAGEKVFTRGQRYADQGQVVLLSASADGVLAAAFGTSDYTIWLNRLAPELSGQCTCPAFEDSGLCKHMVAAALLANEAADVGDSPVDSVGKVAEQIARLDRRRLEKLLLEMAMADWRMLRSLHYAVGLDWEVDLDESMVP